MQLGFVTAILPELSLAEVLQFAQETGYDCVEVMCWPPSKAERRYAGITHIDVTDFSAADADRVRKLCDETGVAISGLGYYPNALCPNQEESDNYVAHIRKTIAASATLGINVMTSFVGRDWTKSVNDNWPRFLEVWRPIIAFAEKQNVRVAIENCPMLFSDDEWPGGKNLAYSPAIWRRMFADIPSNHFGLNYDPSHPTWLQMDAIKPIWEFADKIYHAHAKDVRVDRSKLDDVGVLGYPPEFHTPKLPGLGDVNWGQFFSALTDVGYDGPVCVEVEDRAYEGTLESRKDSLRQSARYLKNFLP